MANSLHAMRVVCLLPGLAFGTAVGTRGASYSERVAAVTNITGCIVAPHDIDSPPDAHTGGPFTSGLVIRSSRNVGLTGWTGGVAVFDRALTAEKMARMSPVGSAGPIATATR